MFQMKVYSLKNRLIIKYKIIYEIYLKSKDSLWIMIELETNDIVYPNRNYTSGSLQMK